MFPAFLKGKKKITFLIIATLLLVGGGFVLALKNGDEKTEVVSVERRDLEETVNVAGTVRADTTSDLGFEISGTVRSISVDEGSIVRAGQILASLDLGTLSAELKSAEAGVALKQAGTGNTTVNLKVLEEKQNTLVESAYKKLLSSDLEAIPESDSTTITAPIISGLYEGGEGQYRLVVLPGSINDVFNVHISGLEDPAPVKVSENKAIPLGTKGLFITFPGGPRPYSGIRWVVDIPNKRSSSYTTNYNAYLEAIRERDRALEEARAELRDQNGGSSVADAELAQAQAEVDRIKAEIAKRTLYAPFDGVVTDVSIDPGEIVNAGATAVSLISSGGFGVEVELPEVDSVKVTAGDSAEITLDALGDDEVFSATVASVNRTETIVDGVSVYKARLAFDLPAQAGDMNPKASDDARTRDKISSGMTADVVIVTDRREGVLALPARSVKTRENGENYVMVKKGEEIKEAKVATGLRSTDGFIEITAGLNEGDQVVVSSEN